MPDKRELSKDEQDLLRDAPLPAGEDELIVDDDWAEFRKMTPEQQDIIIETIKDCFK